MVLDALEAGPYADNTIIVLFGDHGFHLGEKDWIGKTTLWGPGTRVPLVFAGPPSLLPEHRRGSRVDHTVSLVDVYPTLSEWAGLRDPPQLDGESRLSIILTGKAPTSTTPGVLTPPAAVTVDLHKNVALRTAEWLYVVSPFGCDELYNLATDPNEFVNLAGRTALWPTKRELHGWLLARAQPLWEVPFLKPEEHRTSCRSGFVEPEERRIAPFGLRTLNIQ